MHKLVLAIVLTSTNFVFAQHIDIQGHRGARGLMPENTIPAFIRALELGVTTLELDLVITFDKEIIVSHEPYMSPTICRELDGNELLTDEEAKYNIYKMTYAQTQNYDCGSLIHPRFLDQKKMVVSKPLLSSVIDAVEEWTSESKRRPVLYNIEIKSTVSGDDVFHPKPPEFCELVLNEIEKNISLDKVTIQSFDFRVLQYMNEHHPEVRLAALVFDEKSVLKNISNLGFIPDIYSPYFKHLSRKKVNLLHDKKIKVIPWTVNSRKKMNQLIEWGVDGIITDYPDKAQGL